MNNFRIAILDSVPKKYWSTDGGITDGMKFRDLLSAQDPDAEYDIYYVAEGQWPDDLGDYDGIMLTGSPCSVNDEFDWIQRLSELVVDAVGRNQRVAASCFGHQLVAKTFGGVVGANEDGWMIGNYRLKIHQQHPWMEPVADSTRLFHFNRERVYQLPDGARSFARSSDYPDFAYTLGDNVFCLQGHPEQPLRAMKNFLRETEQQLSRPELKRSRRMIETGQPDAALWGRWLSNFFRA